MIIGVDARAAAEVPAGRGRVVRELLRGLADTQSDHIFNLYCRQRADVPGLDQRFRWMPVPSRDPIWHLRAASRANRECAVFLSTNSYLTAWFLRIPAAVIIYDLIPFRQGAHAQRRAQLIEKATIRPALRRAGSLLCISNATRDDLVELFPRAAPKARVVHLAVNERFQHRRGEAELNEVTQRHGLSGSPFVLCTGTLEPRKNLVRLVDAFVALDRRLRDTHVLALVGPKGWDADEIESRVAAHSARVRLLGYVSDDDLAALYQACAVFCYPSLYEGFGLPVLEAMTCGAPVLTSRLSSMPEIADDAALYVDPLDVPDIRAGLTRLLESDEERHVLIERGRARAAQFSWERTATETLSALEEVAQARSRS